MSLSDYGNNEDDTTDSPSNLSEANRNKLNWLEEHFEERLDELEAENTKLHRELAELKGEEEDF